VEGGGRRGFFFVKAYQGFDASEKYIRQRFRNLYDGGQPDKQTAFGNHFYHIIGERSEERYLQGFRIANELKLTNTELNKLTRYEYFLHLEDLISKANGSRNSN